VIPLALMLAPIEAPDAAPAMAALRSCDRDVIRKLTRDEPRRRTDFAAAAYAEQRGIAAERAALVAPPLVAAPVTSPTAVATAPPASLVVTTPALEMRQKQLEDAREVEARWRDLLDELRADFLKNCAGGRVAQD